MAYDNSTRARAAQETRSRVQSAALRAFLENGYASTTIRQVAEAANVSPETIYKRFGSKAGLLKATYDVAMVGDDEPVPVAQRPEVLSMRSATDAAAAATAYAAFVVALMDRAGALMRIALHARGSDPDLDAFVATIDNERLVGSAMAVADWAEHGWLRQGLDVDRARDILWTLNSPSVWFLLSERDWGADSYAAWLADTLLVTVLVDE